MNCIRLLRLVERQSFNVLRIPAANYASQHPVRFMETQKMWRETDGVSQRWELIYKAPMNTGLKFTTTYLTLTSGLAGVGGIYYAAFVYDDVDFGKPVTYGENVVIADSPTEYMAYIGAFIALHMALKILLSKYVIRLYKDGDEYLAIYRGHFFNSIKTHKFNVKEFKKIEPLTSIIPWHESRFALGKKQGILMENYFKTPEHFNYLLYKKSTETAEDDD